jgi:hypothetical protein
MPPVEDEFTAFKRYALNEEETSKEAPSESRIRSERIIELISQLQAQATHWEKEAYKAIKELNRIERHLDSSKSRAKDVAQPY